MIQNAIKEEKKGDEEAKKAHFDVAKECFIHAAEMLMGIAKANGKQINESLKTRIHNLLTKVFLSINWQIEKYKAVIDKEEEKKTTKIMATFTKYNPGIIDSISQSILSKSAAVRWEDLIGLEELKGKIMETIVLPMKNPELFTGLRSPSKGILLFGPPGNGKTMVAKAIASQCDKVTFFNLSGGTITSKNFGDSEKIIQALFAMASAKQPSVIFIDEIDSILGARSSEEHEASRRIKTEFLVQFDGVGTVQSDKIVVIGATNRPFDLDEAVLRRFTARIFLPLPGLNARMSMLKVMISTVNSKMTMDDIKSIAKHMERYSFADMKAVCQEAAMEPIRGFPYEKLSKMKKEEVPPLLLNHFKKALAKVPASVSKKTIEEFEKWNKRNQN